MTVLQRIGRDWSALRATGEVEESVVSGTRQFEDPEMKSEKMLDSQRPCWPLKPSFEWAFLPWRGFHPKYQFQCPEKKLTLKIRTSNDPFRFSGTTFG